MKTKHYCFVLFLLVLIACQPAEPNPPNIILIMADDMGYESVNTYIPNSYETPELDKLAKEGMQFNYCYSQPLCTPSRVKIMTGKYNYKNYDYFGHLNANQQTFGNLMKKQGYATCIVGKWQLNGLAYPNEIQDWNNPQRPVSFGFDEYCLWQLTKKGNEGGRYANPLIEQNGEVLELKKNDYGPDVFNNYLMDFITRKKEKPFFIYYPMVLVHDPFVATPNTTAWETEENRYKNDTTYYRDMVSYADKIVGNIANHLENEGITDNTILIFTTDNGTHPSIYTKTKKGIIRGGKGNTTDAGTRVPLIIRWPDKIKPGSSTNAMIAFNDFYPTFAELIGETSDVDGKSFLPLLVNEKYKEREHLFIHYDPKWNKRVSQYRNQFVRTHSYKLYATGEFFNVKEDVLEQNPLRIDALQHEAKEVFIMLDEQLKQHPTWK